MPELNLPGFPSLPKPAHIHKGIPIYILQLPSQYYCFIPWYSRQIEIKFEDYQVQDGSAKSNPDGCLVKNAIRVIDVLREVEATGALDRDGYLGRFVDKKTGKGGYITSWEHQ